MVISLVELAADVARDEVKLPGGRAVAVRGLEAWEQTLIMRALPRPSPPMILDPDKGSASTDKVPDFTDAKYLDAHERWSHDYRLACAAAGTDHAGWLAIRGTAETPASTAEAVKWFEGVRVELAKLGKPLVMKLCEKIDDLGAYMSAGQMDAAEKK